MVLSILVPMVGVCIHIAVVVANVISLDGVMRGIPVPIVLAAVLVAILIPLVGMGMLITVMVTIFIALVSVRRGGLVPIGRFTVSR